LNAPVQTAAAFDLRGAVLAAQAQGGGRIMLPPGRFHYGAGVVVEDVLGAPVEIIGVGGYGAYASTTLVFDTEDPAICLLGSGNSIRGVRITAGDHRPAAGVFVKSSFNHLERVTADNCESGFIVKGVHQGAYGNRFEQCRAFKNAVHGYLTEGFDCGTGLFVGCQAKVNGYSGFTESSGLGNVYLTPHAENNAQGSPEGERWGYRVEGAANYASFHGGYVENSDDVFVEGYQATAFGGNLANRWPEGRPCFGYRSEMRAEAHEHILGVPSGNSALTARHYKDRKAWRLWERVQSSLPWLKNTRVIRSGPSSFAPLASTDERHPLGPGLPLAANARAPSRFDTLECVPLVVDGAGEHVAAVSSWALAPAYPGRPITAPSILSAPGSAAAYVTSVCVQENTALVSVRTEGAGTYDIQLRIQRWALGGTI